MISTRSDFLAAIRIAQPGPDGIRLGPVAYVSDDAPRDIILSGVTDAQSKTKLIDMVKRAPSKYFAAGAFWEMPHVRQERSEKSRVDAKSGAKRSPRK